MFERVLFKIFNKYRLPSIKSLFSFASIGSGLAWSANAIYEDVASKSTIKKEYPNLDCENIVNSSNQLSTHNETIRKKKLISSVYNQMGVPYSLNQIHIGYDENVSKISFSHTLFSKNLCLAIPKSKLYMSIKDENEFIVLSAKQAANDKKHHDVVKSMWFGGGIGFIFGIGRTLGVWPSVLMSFNYVLAQYYLRNSLDYKLDSMIIEKFPDYASDLTTITQNTKNILQRRTDDNAQYNKTYERIFQWMGTHRSRFDPVMPLSKYPHPFTRSYKKNNLHLVKKQQMAIIRLQNSARVYLPEEIELILREFFELHKSQDTKLGELYKMMSFGDFIERLLSKTYKAVYLDGRLLRGREEEEGRLLKALENYPQTKTEENCHLLTAIGGSNDINQVYLDYLSLDEIAIKSLLITQAICLPIGDGRRETHYSINSKSDSEFTLPILKSFFAAEKKPISLSAVSGIEARNGYTLHPDLFMIFMPKQGNQLWEKMKKNYRGSPYYQVAKNIYGKNLAIDYLPQEVQDDKNFILFGENTSHGQWYVCAPAYKSRMKLLYRSLLLSADKQMSAYDLGHAYNLKGIGLGYFGFSAASSILENLSKEALYETLNEIQLLHIRQINLINWPSQILTSNPDKSLDEQSFLNEVTIVKNVKIYEGIAEAFAIAPGGCAVGGTHSCGDAASKFGNEANIGLPPSSSDDAATYYSILDPSVFDAKQNQDLSLRLKA